FNIKSLGLAFSKRYISLAHVAAIVPQPDRGFRQVVFIAQGAQARSTQQEQSAAHWLESEPTRGKHSQKVSARENQNLPLDHADLPQHTISPCTNLTGVFTVWATITKQLPVRAFGKNLSAATALIISVVPFDQISFNLGNPSETSQFTSPGRALQRASEHLGESETP